MYLMIGMTTLNKPYHIYKYKLGRSNILLTRVRILYSIVSWFPPPRLSAFVIMSHTLWNRVCNAWVWHRLVMQCMNAAQIGGHTMLEASVCYVDTYLHMQITFGPAKKSGTLGHVIKDRQVPFLCHRKSHHNCTPCASIYTWLPSSWLTSSAGRVLLVDNTCTNRNKYYDHKPWTNVTNVSAVISR